MNSNASTAASSSGTSTTAAPPTTTNPAVLYKETKIECNQLLSKIVELEIDRNEHILVEETLRPLDPNRRAYRLVGEILVERTVAEVLPSVVTNRTNVRVFSFNKKKNQSRVQKLMFPNT